MRLSDAGLHQRQTKALNPNHRPPPWPNEDVASRSPEPIVRRYLPQYHLAARATGRELGTSQQISVSGKARTQSEEPGYVNYRGLSDFGDTPIEGIPVVSVIVWKREDI
jgi:hypothetical protein